jgi:hypothetical protein
MVSHARHYFTLGLYLNGILVSGSSRTMGGIDNTVIPIPVQITLNVTGSDVIDIRINSDDTLSYVSVEGINASSASQIDLTTVFSTNDTNPITIPDLNVSGLSGDILFIGTLNCQLNYARQTFTVGFYKNNALISNSQYVYGGVDQLIIPVPIQTFVTMGTSDVFSIKINVNTASVSVSILSATLINIMYSSSLSMIPSISLISPTISTNSIVPYILSDLTLTGLSNGNYLIFGDLNCYVSHSHHFFNVGLYKNGVLLLEKLYGGVDSVRIDVPFQILVPMTITDIFTIRINSDDVSNVIFVNERSIGSTIY